MPGNALKNSMARSKRKTANKPPTPKESGPQPAKEHNTSSSTTLSAGTASNSTRQQRATRSRTRRMLSEAPEDQSSSTLEVDETPSSSLTEDSLPASEPPGTQGNKSALQGEPSVSEPNGKQKDLTSEPDPFEDNWHEHLNDWPQSPSAREKELEKEIAQIKARYS
ncbi:hypothetical protein NM688_g7724 [Phlebia brevispora]|uniref:Uncharacterized protein n=1 Tax=Phlebia brevispora TaxID=194682 RepID=A0ACC1S2C4_9APHY|nr:hypothetical protein NM688_g7724 [Phlebia brevispora]